MGPTDQQVTAGEKVLLECTTTLGSGGFQPLIGWSRKGEGIKLHTCWYITYGLFTYITHQTDVDLWFFDDSSSCIQVLSVLSYPLAHIIRVQHSSVVLV